MERLSETLRSGEAAALRLTWTSGGPSATAKKKLQIETGQAALLRCDPSCQPVGAPLKLSVGEQSQLVSRLRAAGLSGLRDGESEADRELEVGVGAESPLRWRLPRADWPAPPDGYGLADYLDELGQRIERAAAVRAPVPLPRSVEELRRVRLQLRVEPRNRPGGLLYIEQGKLHVTPEEGSLPRTPRPRPYERPLTEAEEARLLSALQAARLDELDGIVPKRGQPAIGDTDGRLVRLHLMPTDALPGGKVPATSKPAEKSLYQPRGHERYVADLLRSPAAPLVQELFGYLVNEFSEGKAAAPPAPSARGAARPRK
jgi:hypothetical protein